MNNKQFDEILSSPNLNFSEEEKRAFEAIVAYAKTCQSSGNIEQIKPMIKEITNRLIDR